MCTDEHLGNINYIPDSVQPLKSIFVSLNANVLKLCKVYSIFTFMPITYCKHFCLNNLIKYNLKTKILLHLVIDCNVNDSLTSASKPF